MPEFVPVLGYRAAIKEMARFRGDIFSRLRDRTVIREQANSRVPWDVPEVLRKASHRKSRGTHHYCRRRASQLGQNREGRVKLYRVNGCSTPEAVMSTAGALTTEKGRVASCPSSASSPVSGPWNSVPKTAFRQRALPTVSGRWYSCAMQG